MHDSALTHSYGATRSDFSPGAYDTAGALFKNHDAYRTFAGGKLARNSDS